MRVRVDVVALDGVLDAALGVTFDVLAAANRIARASGRSEPFAVRLVSTSRTLRTGTGRRTRADAVLSNTRPGDVLVVLGMNVPTVEEITAALARRDVARAIERLRAAARHGTLVLASCSATFLCAEAGLLDGRDATTSWWLTPLFRARYPRVHLRDDAMVVDARTVVTAGAALSQVDLMLWLVRRFAGPGVADLCMRYLVVDERPSQARYCVTDQLAHGSEIVSRAEAFARKRLHQSIGVEDLARAASTTARTLERRFDEALGISPLKFLQRLRVERAAHLLATTELGVDAIAERVGYDDPASLRRVVRRELGVSPSSLRGRGRG